MWIVRTILAAVMAGFAIVQLNDPDPWLWTIAYALIAICILLSGRTRWAFAMSVFACGMLFALALSSLPGFLMFLASGDFGSLTQEMSADRPYVEPAREFLGVAIAGIALALGRGFPRRSDIATRDR
jgi:amino acid permease